MELRAAFHAALLAAAASAASGQEPPAVDGVTVRVEALEEAGARVTATYAIRMSAADTMELSAVRFFGLGIADLAVSSDGGVIGAAEGGPSGALSVRVPLPEGSTALEVVYTVPSAGRASGRAVDLRVPLLLPRAVPASSTTDFFRVELTGSPGSHVVESFPTVPDAGSMTGALHTMTLPVAPGLLRWRITTGEAPRVTFAGAVDAGVVALLLILAVLGVRVLRRPVEDA